MLSMRIACCDWRSNAKFEDLMLSLRISCFDWRSHDEFEDLLLSLRISGCDWRSHDEFEDLMLSLRISCCDWRSHDELEDFMLSLRISCCNWRSHVEIDWESSRSKHKVFSLARAHIYKCKCIYQSLILQKKWGKTLNLAAAVAEAICPWYMRSPVSTRW